MTRGRGAAPGLAPAPAAGVLPAPRTAPGMLNSHKRRRQTMGAAEAGEGGKGGRAWNFPPMSGGRGLEAARSAEAPSADDSPPPPGTPYNDRGAVIISTDPCVIYDPDIEKNEGYLRSMTAEDAERYKGQWIAIADGGVVAHGTDPLSVCGEGHKADKGAPLMYFVQEHRDLIPFFVLGE